jgi:hypothetical protein
VAFLRERNSEPGDRAVTEKDFGVLWFGMCPCRFFFLLFRFRCSSYKSTVFLKVFNNEN